MARYVNVGAWVLLGPFSDRRVKTKAELKRLLASPSELGPGSVRFDHTGLFDHDLPPTMSIDDIKPGMVLSVVGPDPYTDRRWYASVKLNEQGKVVVT